MSDQEGDFGDYMDEEDDYEAGAFEEEEEVFEIESEIPKKTIIDEGEAMMVEDLVVKSYKYEIIEEKEVFSLLKKTIVHLKNQYEFAEIDEGVFWQALQENNYFSKITARRLEDKIFDYMEQRAIHKIEPSKKYECEILGEELKPHEISHFGCGHVIHIECMKDFITNEIETRGKNAIYSTCPHDGCPFLLTEAIVSQYCDPTIAKRFKMFLIMDFIEKHPCIMNCSNPLCNKYILVGEEALNSKRALPPQDCSCICGQITCGGCKKIGHQPLSCEFSKKWRDEVEESTDKLNLEWKKNNTKKCPKCGVDIFKNTGCMHITCSNCKYEFCWFCLKDKESHKGKHITSCSSMEGLAQQQSEKEQNQSPELVKLKFCVNQFLEHEYSLKILIQNSRDLKEVLSGKSVGHPIVSKFVKKFPEFFTFYEKAIKDAIIARSFLMNTFALQFVMKNQKELLLFFETQHLFQNILENLTELLENNPLDSFVVEINSVICPKENYEKKKFEIESLSSGLNKNYETLRKELSSEIYQKKISEAVNIDIKAIAQDSVEEEVIQEEPEKNEIWTCFYCSKANKNSGAWCATCKKKTYADSVGAWICDFCANSNKRTSETCQNIFCKKGLRPLKALGIWDCGLCGFKNRNNFSKKCKFCNRISDK